MKSTRYHRTLKYLMATLALLGFLVAYIGSGRLAAIYCVVYLAVLIRWVVMTHRSGW